MKINNLNFALCSNRLLDYNHLLCANCLLGYNHLLYANRLLGCNRLLYVNCLLGYNLVKSGARLFLFLPLRVASHFSAAPLCVVSILLLISVSKGMP